MHSSRMPSQPVRQAVPAELAADPPDQRQEVPYVPSMVEDPRYPSSDGQRMAESTRQADAMIDAVSCLEVFFRDRKDVFLASDLLIYYREAVPAMRVAPDVFVAFGVPKGHRMNYKLWKEGRPPDFVLEIASPTTVKEDVERKPGLYARIGVREYWQFDPHGDLLSPRLQGRQLVGSNYRDLTPVRQLGEKVWYASVALGLMLVLDGERLRFWDPARQGFLLTHSETAEALLAARQARLEAEESWRTRQEAEEGRQTELRAANAEIARLKALLQACEQDP